MVVRKNKDNIWALLREEVACGAEKLTCQRQNNQ
jgi:hypothetical protein